MTILYRYVTGEILACLGMVLAAVLSIYTAVDFIEKIDNFLEAGVPAGRLGVYLLFKLPYVFVQIAPVGFLLSILIALGLMNKNNEVVALKSCGIGKRRLVQPAVTLGVVLCGLLFWVAETVVPPLTARANQIWLQEVRKKNVYASRTHDIWIRTPRQIVHIDRYLPEKRRIVEVTIHTFDEQFRLTGRTDAESGTFAQGRWHLTGAVVQSVETDGQGRQFATVDGLAIDLDLNPDDLARAAKRSDEMGLAELRRYIAKVEREGYGAVRYRVDYHGKMAAPVVCLFLGLLGTGIALRGELREGIPASVAYGLGVAFFYWVFNSFCLALGYAEMMPPVVAAWAANLVFMCASGWLLLKAS